MENKQEYYREYRKKNKEKLSEYQRKYREKNKGYSKNYYQCNKERFKGYREKNMGLFLYFILDRDKMEELVDFNNTLDFSNNIFYFGSTTNMQERKNLHNCAKVKTGNILYQLKEKGYNPIIYYLDLTNYLDNKEELLEIENYYIDKLNKINPNNNLNHICNKLSRDLWIKYNRLVHDLAHNHVYFREWKEDKNGYEWHYEFPPTYLDLILHNRWVKVEEEKRNAKIHYLNESCWTWIPNNRDKDEFLTELKSKDNICAISFYKDISSKFCKMVENYGIETDDRLPQDVAKDMAKLKLYLYILESNDGGNLFELHRKDKKIAYFKAKEVNGKFKIDNIKYIDKEIKDE